MRADILFEQVIVIALECRDARRVVKESVLRIEDDVGSERTRTQTRKNRRQHHTEWRQMPARWQCRRLDSLVIEVFLDRIRDLVTRCIVAEIVAVHFHDAVLRAAPGAGGWPA